MAFNPFHGFRKHQKVFMAGLVLVAMITFIFSFGAGDFFSQATGWFRTTTSPKAFKLYGKDVTIRELEQLRTQREIARRYLGGALQTAMSMRENELRKDIEKLKLPQEQVMQHLFSRMVSDSELNTLGERMQSLAERRPGETEQPDRLEELIDFMIWRHQADRLNIYLTDADIHKEFNRLTNDRLTSSATRELQLGLRRQFKNLTPSILMQALSEEFRVRLARAALEGYEPGTKAQVPAPITPDEFWDFYKDRRTELQFALLAIPVRELSTPEIGAGLIGLSGQFGSTPLGTAAAATAALAPDTLLAIKEKPTEAELQALFKKHRSEEPRPESDTPGFKQPRRIQLQWVSTRTDAPEYQKAGKDAIAVSQAAWSLALGSAVAQRIPAPLFPLGEAPLPLSLDLRLLYDYEDNKRLQYEAPRWTDPNFALAFYQGLNKPENVSAVLAQAVAQAGTQGTFLGLPAAYQAGPVARGDRSVEGAIARETQKRIPVGCTLLLAGSNPWGGLTAVTPLTYSGRKDQYLPLEAVRDQLVERLQEAAGREIAINRLLDFARKELEEGLKKPEARKEKDLYLRLDAAARQAGLQTGYMPEPRGQLDIARDPAIKPLRSALVQQRGPRPVDRQAERQFGESLFTSTAKNLFEPDRLPKSFFARTAAEDQEWKAATEPILFWKIKEEPATIPPSLDKVRDQVITAWKLNKARELAQKRADALAREVESNKSKLQGLSELAARKEVRQQLEDIKTRHGLQSFELGPVARLLERKAFRPDLPRDYEPYRVPEDRILHDPRSDFATKFADQLLGLKDKGVGSAVVVTDQPRETYYVAVLVAVDPPTPAQFWLTFRDEASSPTPRPTSLLGRLEQERRTQYRKEFLAQLRQQAGIDADNPSAEFRKSYGGAGGPEE
jgi:hypothetical protein